MSQVAKVRRAAARPVASAASAPELGGRRVVVVMPAYNASETLRKTWQDIPQGLGPQGHPGRRRIGRHDPRRRPRAQGGRDRPSPQCWLRRQPEDLLHGGAAPGRRRGRDGPSRRPIRPDADPAAGAADHPRRGRHGARFPLPDPGRGAQRRDAALQDHRQPLPDRRREPGPGASLRRASHRLSRLHPWLPGDHPLPSQLERFRLRYRSHRPGGRLWIQSRRGAGRDQGTSPKRPR